MTVVGTDESITLRDIRRAKERWKNSSQAATSRSFSGSALPITNMLFVRTLRHVSLDCGAARRRGFACAAPLWRVHSAARISAMKIFIESFPVGGAVKGLDGWSSFQRHSGADEFYEDIVRSE